jgi:LacI family transcriptional regulator
VVLMGTDPEDPEVRRLARSDLPTVGVDVELEGHATTFVISDNVDGGSRAVRHFHSLGHRRIATITGLLETRPGADRLRGYRQAMQACGLAYRDEYIAYGDFYVESGRRAMTDLLSLDEPPTAVFAASDMMALGAIRAAGDAGLNVPADLSVIGFDDIQLADHMNPPLTTLRQDKAGLGVSAGSALVRLIDGEQDAVTQYTVLPVELVRRGSTRPRAAT